ncbi:endonuclease [Thermacetogenium phaeum DSM 12270]|uniref:UPF0102 protein Tph_c10340 n=1 Tax=Thermacetogenium phaeum (strain ATCC BAA-254 / DSM 26808 / PB) TaxID=1089553 RepID=K4LGR5_THEPS|nr:YraN family protein [Thermacetogenium phaeum]AFV11257.1 endonuclease [Thermacetogenium phaeum DSM 12270]
MGSARSVGLRGEELALSFLSRLGYHLLEKNYRCRLGEIDLIMKDGQNLVFIEVKTRRSDSYGAPQEAVGPLKQAKIRKLARYYLMTKGIREQQVRFDVVAIRFGGGKYHIEHLKGVF